jgi:hypothetical protein
MASESLKGKTALITGAAKRIGRATALALAGEGANIVVHYNRSEHDARQLCSEIEARGAKSWAIAAEFDKPGGQADLIDRAVALAGALDILVNNASIFPSEKLMDLSFEQLETNLRINAFTPFDLCRQFARRVGRGKIINMHDSRLRGYDWLHVGYIASKQVLELFTRMLALELAPKITVNAVAPGLVLPPPGRDMSYIEGMVNSLPMKKHGEPQDVADAIVYLLKSTFLTGQTIYVDGGRHLRENSDGPNPH